MKTTVIKCNEVVNNDNLRGMNELRITLIKMGDGSGVMRIQKLKSPEYIGDNITPIWKIISGTAHFTDPTGTQNYGIKREAEYVDIMISSDKAVLSIPNFDLSSDCIGYEENQAFLGMKDSANSLLPTIKLSEIKEKTELKSIKLRLGIASGNLKELTNLINLNYIGALGFTVNGIPESLSPSLLEGNLSDIPMSVTKFEPVLANQSNEWANIQWSFEDIANRPNLKSIVLDNQPLLGGDLYSMLASHNGDFSLSATRINNRMTNRPSITCSYISGTSSIPSLNIGTINLYDTGRMENEDTVSFLTLLKDGIDFNKITVSSRIRLTVKDPTYEATTALVNTLSGNPYNIDIATNH